MASYTVSCSRGDCTPGHATRTAYRLKNGELDMKKLQKKKNIDPSRIDDDVVLCKRTFEEVYEEAFGEALKEFNAKQIANRQPKRQKGTAVDYLDACKHSKNKTKYAYEMVIQVGGVEVGIPPESEAVEMLTEWYNAYEKEYGDTFRTVNAIIHLDETTPHLHLECVPVATSTRGLSVQNSLNKALAQIGFESHADFALDLQEKLLRSIVESHGHEVVHGQDTHRHMPTEQWKRYCRVEDEISEKTAEVEELTSQKERLRREVEELERTSPPENMREAKRIIEQGKAADERIPGLLGECTEAANKVSRLEGAIETERTESASRINELKKNMEGERTEATGRIKQLESAIEAERTAAARRISELEGAIKTEREAAPGRIRELKEAISEEKQRVREFTSKTDAARKKVKDTVGESAKRVSEVKGAIETERTASDERVAGLTRQIYNLRARFKDLRGRIVAKLEKIDMQAPTRTLQAAVERLARACHITTPAVRSRQVCFELATAGRNMVEDKMLTNKKDLTKDEPSISETSTHEKEKTKKPHTIAALSAEANERYKNQTPSNPTQNQNNRKHSGPSL